jgi:alcohol dehydrogenase (cytochrome c)
VFNKVGDERFVCPTTHGGKDFPAGAYSPLTHTMYYPLQNTCALVTVLPDKPWTTSLYGIRNKNQIAPGTDKIGTVQAINVETGRITWKHERRAGMMSLVTTGGGLIFGGDTNGHFPRSIRLPAKCCGRSTSARRSPVIPSATPSAAGSASR